MKTPFNYQVLLKKIGQIVVFAAAILITTGIALRFGSITGASTVAFCFIIIVVLSAFFGNVPVALTTSACATLCFDYFFLPPFGTFHIAAFSDWISLAAFLLTAVVISYLTASAAEKTAKLHNLDNALLHLKELGMCLMSIPGNQLTLTIIAEKTLRIFSLEYCSIHVYGEGKWRHYTGAAATSDISLKIESHLNKQQDHNPDLIEIIDENMLGVQYMKINEGKEPHAILVVKTQTLSTGTIGAIANMLGIRIMEIINK